MNMMEAIVKKNDEDSTFSKEQVPVPQINDDELLVRIRAIGVGIHDGYFLPENMQFPYPIGIEAAGITKEVGNGAAGFSVGDRVVFVNMMNPKGGTWAEYATVSKDALLLKVPDEMTFTTAAAIPVAGNTVLKALHDLPLEQGDSLFIAGASGAIGTFAIQLAKQRGLHVAGSASQKNHDYMQSLGAEFTVDYQDPDWQEQVKKWRPGGVDAALAIQPTTGKPSMEVVKDGGVVIPVSEYELSGERSISVRPISHKVDVTQELTTMLEQIVTNDMQLTIEKTYRFVDALDALNKTATRRARGKIVIDLQEG